MSSPSASGGLQGILTAILPEHRHMLRLAGRERVELTLPPGLSDESSAWSMPANLCPCPQSSPQRCAAAAWCCSIPREAGLHFSAECDRLGIHRAGLALAVIGPRVASAVGEGWARVTSAASPDDQALLALASRMCQNNPGSIA